MIYVLSIPVVLILVLIVWVVTRMLRSRAERDRPSSATAEPRLPSSDMSEQAEVPQ